jgi:hypothetical protein
LHSFGLLWKHLFEHKYDQRHRYQPVEQHSAHTATVVCCHDGSRERERERERGEEIKEEGEPPSSEMEVFGPSHVTALLLRAD